MEESHDPSQAPNPLQDQPPLALATDGAAGGSGKGHAGPGRPKGIKSKYVLREGARYVPITYRADKDLLDCPIPRSVDGLHAFVKRHFGIHVPLRAVCPHHNAPMDYLVSSFLHQQDLLVWANRGGGKTFLAAVATLLDALVRRPINVCVLGGSFDQSDRLADHVRNLLDLHSPLVHGRMTRTHVRLTTGSEIEMLAQSQKAVRGQHVQKFRCDEVDLFDSGVWRAIQFATNSRKRARGSIEVLSTLHRSGGLMQQLVEEARSGQAAPAATTGGYRLIQWCLWEVIEKCPPSRRCDRCPLWDDCRGVARKGQGHFRIDDAIRIQARSSRNAWESEMLCRGARCDHLVLGEFSPARHVTPVEYDANLPLYRGIDFGYRSPMVCLWMQVTPGGQVRVIQEYVQPRRALEQHARTIRDMDPGAVVASFADPAGRAHESVSGTSCVEQLQQFGIPCQTSPSTIAAGLELIRGALDPAGGAGPLLKVHPRCRRLIEAFENYHYPPPESPGDPNTPVKDGPDHCIDALRYFFIGIARKQRDRVKMGRY